MGLAEPGGHGFTRPERLLHLSRTSIRGRRSTPVLSEFQHPTSAEYGARPVRDETSLGGQRVVDGTDVKVEILFDTFSSAPLLDVAATLLFSFFSCC